MENKRKAVEEVLGVYMSPNQANKYFMNVYEYLLISDTQSLMETLDFKSTLRQTSRSVEGYEVFKYILKLLKGKQPNLLIALSPVKFEQLKPTLRFCCTCPLHSLQKGV